MGNKRLSSTGLGESAWRANQREMRSNPVTFMASRFLLGLAQGYDRSGKTRYPPHASSTPTPDARCSVVRNHPRVSGRGEYFLPAGPTSPEKPPKAKTLTADVARPAAPGRREGEP